MAQPVPAIEPPVMRFFIKWLPLSLVVVSLGCLIAGGLSVRTGLQILPHGDQVEPDIVSVSVRHFGMTIRDYVYAPEYCVGGKLFNSLQQKKCDEFWDRMLLEAGIAAIPFVLFGLYWFVLLDRFSLQYRRMRRIYAETNPAGQGKVGAPAQHEPDAHSKFFHLRRLRVIDSNGKPVDAYQPLEWPIPLSGEQVLLFDAGGHRFFSRHYAPHMHVRSAH